MQTNAYGIGECSDVSNTIPMLVPYYHSIGLYATNGSDNSNNNSSDDNESNDTSDEARHCSEASGNSNLSEDEDYATPIIDARYFIVASISDVEPSEEIQPIQSYGVHLIYLHHHHLCTQQHPNIQKNHFHLLLIS